MEDLRVDGLFRFLELAEKGEQQRHARVAELVEGLKAQNTQTKRIGRITAITASNADGYWGIVSHVKDGGARGAIHVIESAGDGSHLAKLVHNQMRERQQFRRVGKAPKTGGPFRLE